VLADAMATSRTLRDAPLLSDNHATWHSTSDLEGQWRMIYFWSPRCVTCNRDIFAVNSLAHTYGDLVLTAVADDEFHQASQFTSDYGLTLTTVGLSRDALDASGITTPAMYFITPDRRLVAIPVDDWTGFSSRILDMASTR
jgi:hypothetical protein